MINDQSLEKILDVLNLRKGHELKAEFPKMSQNTNSGVPTQNGDYCKDCADCQGRDCVAYCRDCDCYCNDCHA